MTAIVSRWAHARHSAGRRTGAARHSADAGPVLPDYGGRSLAELTPSLFAALGVPA